MICDPKKKIEEQADLSRLVEVHILGKVEPLPYSSPEDESSDAGGTEETTFASDECGLECSD